MHLLPHIIVYLLVRAFQCSAAVKVELSSGEIQTVENPKDIKPPTDSTPGNPILNSISVRDLFGRQSCSAPGTNVICSTGCCPNDEYCCEDTSCIDVSEYRCCVGGSQCYEEGECCGVGSCCDPGDYCVTDLDTGELGCLPYSGGYDTYYSYSETIQEATTSAPPTTTPPAPTASTSTYTYSEGLTCDDAGYEPCPDQQYCCPSGDYCFYNNFGSPRCWDGDVYYTFYYYYSWSWSFGVRYYSTSTTYYLGDSTVPAITTPPPPSTPPSSTDEAELTYTPPSLSSYSISDLDLPTPSITGGLLPGGDAASSSSLFGGGPDVPTPTLPSSTPDATSTPSLLSGGGSSSSNHETAYQLYGWSGSLIAFNILLMLCISLNF